MREALQAAAVLFKVHVLKRRIPLFLSWNITFRCNLQCKYCASCDAPRDELDTAQVLAGLDTVWDLGTRWITFGGGEPLVRTDIGEIFEYAKRKGFQIYISTNGVLVPAKSRELACVDHVNISMDGYREVHDSIRGEGAFDKAVEAIGVCKDLEIPVSLQCVLSKHNLDKVHEPIDIAAQHAVYVMFQPAGKWMSSSMKPNPLAPEHEPYRAAIEEVIRLKRQGAPVRNSIPGLQHLACWPNNARIWCVAGRLISIVEADGSVLACHQCQIAEFLEGKAGKGITGEQFKNLDVPKNCTQCWCAPLVELAMIFTLRPSAVLNAIRTR